MRTFFSLCFMLALLSYAGCQPASSPDTSSETEETAAVEENQSEEIQEESDAENADNSGNVEGEVNNEAVGDETAEEETQDSEAAETSADTGRNVKADVGVGQKGNFVESPEKPMAIVSVPLATYFRAQDQMTFRTLIPHAMDLYKAENGDYPKTAEQFWTDIIQANQIKLPQLPEGDEYYYDPATAQLMVNQRR